MRNIRKFQKQLATLLIATCTFIFIVLPVWAEDEINNNLVHIENYNFKNMLLTSNENIYNIAILQENMKNQRKTL